MTAGTSFIRRFAVAGLATVVIAGACIPLAKAQFFDERFPFEGRRGGYNNFGPPGYIPQRSAPADNSHAPSPKKYDKNEGTELSTILVLGDSMADWLGYGLETALADSPELTVNRKSRNGSSLIFSPTHAVRSKNFDWAEQAKEILSKEQTNFVVMMIGLSDRDPIRAPAPPPAQPGAQKGAAKGKAGAQPAQGTTPAPNAVANPAAPAGTPADQKQDTEASKAPVDGAPSDDGSTPDDLIIAAPEPTRGGSGTYEFKSEKWVELYTKRLDEVMAALKSKGVPVFWVGLPPIRGTRSTSEVVFLNDLYRARAEKAGITYIDVWDGFVDEGGRFAQQGPDFEGQIRRLRAADGVHFTQAGARKLAHYVEKEIRRAMTPSGPIAIPLPVEPNAPQANTAPTAAPDNSVARPLAGPVLPLNAAGDVGADSDELVGSGGPKQNLPDALAARVLVQGQTPPVPAGRADDFAWPRRGPAALDADPVVARTTLPIMPMLTERPGAIKAAAVTPPTQQSKLRTPRNPSAGGPGGGPSQREARRQQQPAPFFFFFAR